MKFELLVALKYLVPRWRQLSVSIISLISILVVSLVVWLAIVFLSISEGIQERWIDGFVSLNAPVKLTPKEAYYETYYHQIDRYSLASNYTTKSIAQKLTSKESDPYDPQVDQQLPFNLPPNEKKDLVKEAWEAVQTAKARPQVAQVSLCNLKLRVDGSFLSQLCYVTGHDELNERMQKRIVQPTEKDITTFLKAMPGSKESLLKNIDIKEVTTLDYELPFFAPETGSFSGCKIFFPTGEEKVIIPASKSRLEELSNYLQRIGFQTEEVTVDYLHRQPSETCEITFDRATTLQAEVKDAQSGRFLVSGQIQGVAISGETLADHFEVSKAEISRGASIWAYQDEGKLVIPSEAKMGDGVLLSSAYKEKGVSLGDRGYISFMTGTSTSVQEQKTPVYVAGFFDPGIVPMASKVLFVSPDLMAVFEGNLSLPDQMFSNGINVWLDKPQEALAVKQAIESELEKRGLSEYWAVETFYDFEFSRPILQQFDSDKTLFTLVAIMILIVACSNIISMLILLVNDKKREIGILHSLGASPRRIATIFGMCGLFTGLMSCLFGTILAFLTLKNLQSLVHFLNFMKGHELFQKMFFGGDLPNKVSVSAMLFVLGATILISILAGLVPAIKAARIKPCEILRRER